MARHIWSVLCRHIIVDDVSKSMSLHELIDEIEVVGPVSDLPKADLPKSVPLGLASEMHLVSLWRMSAPTREKFSIRTILEFPEGDAIPAVRGMQGEVELGPPGPRSVRTITEFNSLPISTSGTYEFVLQQRAEGASEWVEAARVPLEVELVDSKAASDSSE